MIIDGIEYIKKEGIRKRTDYIACDICNIFGVVRLFDDEPFKLTFSDKEFEYKEEKITILKEYNGDRILIYFNKELWGVYSKELFIKGEKILKIMGYEVQGYLIGNKDSPIILKGNSSISPYNIGVLISPRIADDDSFDEFIFKERKE